MEQAAWGVVIGRYQTPYLHEGHKHTINQVRERHENLLIFLGVQRSQSNDKCPMDFHTRYLMMREMYPDAVILQITDEKYNEVWSEKLDEQVAATIGMNKAVLYGGRDSFINSYTTKRYPTVELESPDKFISATSIREEVIRKAIGTQDFRAGVIHGVMKRYPSPFITVDLAITKQGKLLLVQKPKEHGWRFPGGFVDSTDENLEAAARREKSEELGVNLEIGRLDYIGSFRINDWRYRSSKEKIFTAFYHTECSFGDPDPNDDIKYAKWVTYADLHKETIGPEHQPLMSSFLDYLQQTQP